MHPLQQAIQKLFSETGSFSDANDARQVFSEFRDALTKGEIRAAEPHKSKTGSQQWRVNAWVKQGILLGFRLGELAEMGDPKVLSFVDKDTFPQRRFRVADHVRVVPGGSSVRMGAYVAPSVVCMPPMYINVGAYVDAGTMVDSHALIGSCAQIGKRVHVSAGSQIGGVLEPVNAAPVIVEDDVLIGGNCGIYESALVRKRAVLGSGVILTRSTPIYDLVRGEIYRSSANAPLTVPENAVVVPGSRPITKHLSAKSKEWGLSLYTPVIIKYRDEKTDAAIELEELLR